jgi:peptide/nickel transport system permease protein
VLMRHALPNALSPVITVIGYNLGFMLAGSVFVETVFGWPGMGRLMFDAVTARDFPLLLGLFIIVSLFVVVGNIATDLVHALLDPRAVIR